MYYIIIILWHMWKCTIRAILNLLSTFPLDYTRISRTILILVERTIAKEAVKVLPLFYLVTWKVLTLFILKITVTVLHMNLLITFTLITFILYTSQPSIIQAVYF